MSSADLLKEAERVMGICNACRYCEGYCAVFPAMELRRRFSAEDLKYLANLCHNCRGCYYACQYAPPHEFALNLPKTFSEVRLETYREFSQPGFLSGLFSRNGASVFWITVISVFLFTALAFLSEGTSSFFSAHGGENAFYRVISYPLIVFPFSALGIYLVLCLGWGAWRFWRETGGKPGGLADLAAHRRVIGEVLRLKYLDGGGHGCNYPDDRFRFVRKRYHYGVFYGFLLCFAATSVAAVYEHVLQQAAPYPLLSLPVLLGTLGGAALAIGTGGLLCLKSQMDREPASPRTLSMDVAFTAVLFLTSVTGMLLLIFRETAAMGSLLVVHLGMAAGLLATMPSGKFVHGIYRYAALLRNAIEQAEEKNKRGT